MPRKEQSITTQRGRQHRHEAQGRRHRRDLGPQRVDHPVPEHEEAEPDTEAAPRHPEEVVLARVEVERSLVDEPDGDQGTDAVADIIAAVVQRSKISNNKLQWAENVLNFVSFFKNTF